MSHIGCCNNRLWKSSLICLNIHTNKRLLIISSLSPLLNYIENCQQLLIFFTSLNYTDIELKHNATRCLIIINFHRVMQLIKSNNICQFHGMPSLLPIFYWLPQLLLFWGYQIRSLLGVSNLLLCIWFHMHELLMFIHWFIAKHSNNVSFYVTASSYWPQILCTVFNVQITFIIISVRECRHDVCKVFQLASVHRQLLKIHLGFKFCQHQVSLNHYFIPIIPYDWISRNA